MFDQNIGLDMIDVEWSIISYSAKWLDRKKVIYEDTGGRGKKRVRDDRKLCRSLWKLLHEADWVVAQNGKRFDLKKIDARMVMHGMKPYSPIRVIDTMLVARKRFGFTSNRLAWLSPNLVGGEKYKHKKFPGFELWRECLQDNPAAWAEMRKYNPIDVLETEKVYLKLRPWITGHPNAGAYGDCPEPKCTNCGSTKLNRHGFTVLQQGRYQRYICKDCGAWNRGKQNLILLGNRKRMLASVQ